MKKSIYIIAILVLVIIFIIIVNYRINKELENNAENNKRGFNEIAQEKFKEVEKVIPELSSKGIEYFEENYSIANFYFEEIPSDIETIIELNAITLSETKLSLTGASHVTVSAYFNGTIIYSCDAIEGRINNCE